MKPGCDFCMGIVSMAMSSPPEEPSFTCSHCGCIWESVKMTTPFGQRYAWINIADEELIRKEMEREYE